MTAEPNKKREISLCPLCGKGTDYVDRVGPVLVHFDCAALEQYLADLVPGHDFNEE